jgi:hypothetical protein
MSHRLRFVFRLALALGIPDPEAWYEAIPNRVLRRWEEYAELEGIPWPWLQTGMTTAAICNHLRNPKLRPVRPGDFMPTRKPRPPRQSPAEIVAAFKAAYPPKPRERV